MSLSPLSFQMHSLLPFFLFVFFFLFFFRTVTGFSNSTTEIRCLFSLGETFKILNQRVNFLTLSGCEHVGMELVTLQLGVCILYKIRCKLRSA